ncbi:MAG TPA: accessory factor UbiK family protein [Marinagarivorans sp.]
MLTNIAKQIASELSNALDRADLKDPLSSPHLQTVIQSAVNKCNLVSREEFDAQSAVLQRTRSKLETLEKQLAELEEQIKQTAKT